MTYASSKVVIAFRMPSAPLAKVPYGNFVIPARLFNSETFSDSSLLVLTKSFCQKIKYTTDETTNRSKENTLAIRPITRILFLMTCLLSVTSPLIELGESNTDVRVSSASTSTAGVFKSPFNSSLVQQLSTATSISVTRFPS